MENTEAILERLSDDPATVKVSLGGFCMKGRISKSRGNFYISTSSSLFRVEPEEVRSIKDLEGNKIVK